MLGEAGRHLRHPRVGNPVINPASLMVALLAQAFIHQPARP